jgi:hypothetical protein
MASHAPAALAACPLLRSLVVLRPLGTLVYAALLLGGVLVAANGLKLVAGSSSVRPVAGVCIGLGLGLGGYAVARGLLTSHPKRHPNQHQQGGGHD